MLEGFLSYWMSLPSELEDGINVTCFFWSSVSIRGSSCPSGPHTLVHSKLGWISAENISALWATMTWWHMWTPLSFQFFLGSNSAASPPAYRVRRGNFFNCDGLVGDEEEAEPLMPTVWRQSEMKQATNKILAYVINKEGESSLMLYSAYTP